MAFATGEFVNNEADMRVEVECYSGYKADQRPLRFRVGEHLLEVQTVLDQWYGPSEAWFRVRASDGNIYVLKHTCRGNQDVWSLESFRADEVV